MFAKRQYLLAVAAVISASNMAAAQPIPSRGYKIEQIVPSSGFHTINGLAIDDAGQVLLASASSESIYAFDLQSRKISTFVAPPFGQSDDLAIGRDGSVVWTAIIDGAVRMRTPDGTIRELARNLPGANGLAFSRDGKRLFVGQLFFADGLWELDPAGAQPPRQILSGIGGVNGFSVGADGMIYAPLWFKEQIARIDPDKRTLTVIARDIGHVGAVRIDGKGRIYALDDKTGTIFRINPDSGTKVRIAQTESATDNMIFMPNGHLLVSNMADNSLTDVDPETGGIHRIVTGPLAFPRAVAVGQEQGKDMVYVSDTTAVRKVDPRTGKIVDLARRIVSELGIAGSISLTPDQIVISGGDALGAVQILDRASGRILQTLSKFNRPSDAIKLADGSLVVVEPLAGRLMHVVGDERVPLVTGLKMPTSVLDAGDGSLFVAEADGGSFLRVAVATGKVTRLASGLGKIRDIVRLGPDRLAALDVADRRVITINLSSGRIEVVARNLAVGYLSHPFPRSGGLAAGSDGSLYVAADVENSIYRIVAVSKPRKTWPARRPTWDGRR
jgi:sugar lactone lactonase YvrE